MGQQGAQDAGEVERPLHEVAADQIGAERRGVPGGEEDVDDGEHGVDAGGQLLDGRYPIRDARRSDLLLGPGETRRHRRLTDQEGPGHLGRREPADETERQRDLRIGRDGRMATGEDQSQAIVDDRWRLELAGLGRRHGLDEQGQGSPVRGPAPQDVDGAPPGHGGQPRARIGRQARGGPGGERAGIRILDTLLRQVDVPGDPHRRGEHERPLATVRVGDRRLDRRVGGSPVAQSKVLIGRTSTPPNGMGICLAKASASSRSVASTR